jgi:hypothetical protein
VMNEHGDREVCRIHIREMRHDCHGVEQRFDLADTCVINASGFCVALQVRTLLNDGDIAALSTSAM